MVPVEEAERHSTGDKERPCRTEGNIEDAHLVPSRGHGGHVVDCQAVHGEEVYM